MKRIFRRKSKSYPESNIEKKPHLVDVITAYATLAATIFAGAALWVSIRVMTQTSDLASEQFKLQKEQQIEDSLQQLRALKREDSLSMLHDIFTNKQLRFSEGQLALLDEQRKIISQQQEYQRLSFQSDVVYKSPKFLLAISSITDDSINQKSIITLVIKNVGPVDASEDTVDVYFINENSGRCVHEKNYVGLLSRYDSAKFSIEVNYWTSNSFKYKSNYLFAIITYKNPLLSKMQTTSIGWEFVREYQEEVTTKVSMSQYQIDQQISKYGDRYTPDLQIAFQKKNSDDSSYNNLLLSVLNKTAKNLKNIKITFLFVNIDEKEVLIKNSMSLKSLNDLSNVSIPFSIPKIISHTIEKDGGSYFQVNFQYFHNRSTELIDKVYIGMLIFKEGKIMVVPFKTDDMNAFENEFDSYKFNIE